MIRGIFSGKGGVGKTTTTVNIGLAMHKMGSNVIVVDGNLRNPNLALHLGQMTYGKTLQDVMEKNGNLVEAIYSHETGLKFVPSHISLQYLRTDTANLKKILSESPCDVLIDSPPGLSLESIAVLEACDEVIIVAQPYLPDITDCMKTIEVAREFNKKIRGIILNMVRRKEYELRPGEIEAVTNLPILGIVPWDEEFLMALKMKKPIIQVNPHAPASIEFSKIAANILGKAYIPPEKPTHIKRLIKMLQSRLKAQSRYSGYKG
jgi:septum site-determining protein MinD